MALLTKVTKKIPTVVIKEIIEGCSKFIFIDDHIKNDLDHETYPNIYLNGILMGITKEPGEFINELNLYRKNGLLDNNVSFIFNKVDNEIKIFCDEGRFIRPVLKVDENNKICLKETDNIDWNLLVEKGYIHYIDNYEAENSVIAMDQNDLKKFKCDYCEICPSMMMGVMSNAIPFAEHTQCIFKDEPVYMADGSTKRICDIVVGDKVITFDPKNQKQSITTVTYTNTHVTSKQLYTIETISGRKITATFDHRFMTSEGWKRLEKLKINETLIGISMEPKSVSNDNLNKNIKEGIWNEYLKYISYEYKNRFGFDKEIDYKKRLFSFKQWKEIVKTSEFTIFLPIKSIIRSQENIISDITVNSEENQSFLCGDAFCVHNSSRNIFQSSMSKQAIGIPALSYKTRTDTILHVLNYPERPLVNTLPAQFMKFDDMPMGINAIVAIMTYGGFNQEDSIIINKSAVERGLFVSTSYRTLVDEEKKRETNSTESICLPPPDKRKRHANYSLLDENGIVKTRLNSQSIRVEKGDVIIGKILTKLNKATNKEEIVDTSYIIKSGEEGYVDRVLESVTPNGYKMVKVVIRNEKIPIIGDKFACYTKEHEVLTENGWKFINELSLKDKVACLINGKKLEYHNPTEVQSYDYKGKMYNVESDKVSICVTPNHRMYTGNCHRKNYVVRRADEIYGKMRSYQNNVDEWFPENCLKTFILPAYKDLPKLELDLEAWCIFFGIWIAEGSCSISYYPTGGIHCRQVSIAANKPRVKENLEKCMKILGFKWNYHTEKEEPNKWYCGDLRLIYYLHPLSVGAVNKSLPEWCFILDSHHSQKLIGGMCLGDGDFMKDTTTVRYYTSSIKLRDDFQRLCLHAGWGCNYYLKSEKGSLGGNIDGRKIVSTEDHWSLTVCKTQTNPLVNKYIKNGKQSDFWSDFNDKVYCCTVPTKDGVIYVRRNGKSVWCGQSRGAQKGTVGLIIPQEDMPFTQEGIVPDIVLNPHAIPSRMTINILLEMILGKSCLMEGTFGDATPFTSNSTNIAEKLCDRLEKNGYERHGWETLYSGITGEPITAKVMIGPTTYCRLKHMVAEKIHCLDYNTEVLTNYGWKTIHKLCMDDEIATLKDGTLVYEKPIDIMLYPDYQGSMYTIITKDIDLCVTGNHRMWLKNDNSVRYGFKRADEIVGKPVEYLRSADDYDKDSQKEFEFPKYLTCYLDTFNLKDIIEEKLYKVDMKSWLIVLGNFYRSGRIVNDKIEIQLNEYTYRDKILFHLAQVTDKFIIEYNENKYRDVIQIIDDRIVEYIERYVKNDKLIPDWILGLSKEYSKLFITCAILNKKSITCFDDVTDSKDYADKIQIIALHAGYSAIITEIKDVKTKYGMNIEFNKEIRVDKKFKYNFFYENYEEKVKCPVFCLQVPSEVFYVRRNGKACWTGNSRSHGDVTLLTRQPLEGFENTITFLKLNLYLIFLL